MDTKTEELQSLDTKAPKQHDENKEVIPQQYSPNLEELPSASQEEESDELLEKLKSKLKTIDEDEEVENLHKIKITQEVFEEIRKSLAETVQSMEKNPSLFSRAAKYWGELPMWQKVLGGVALTLPTLIIGIAAHIGFLLAICGVTAVTYAAGGLILDDHHNCTSGVVKSLETGILGLANLLELTINALESIRQKLEAEIEKFAKENDRLIENIDDLSEKIDQLDEQVRTASLITANLEETKEGLVQVTDTLREQTDSLDKNQQKLAHISEAYNTNQLELAKKIAEINELNVQLNTEIDKAEKITKVLKQSLTQITDVALGKQNRELFNQKLEAFLNDKEESYLKIADRICEAEVRLEETQRKLDLANETHHKLLEILKQHIDRLAKVGPQESSTNSSLAKALSEIGIYANSTKPQPNVLVKETSHELTLN